MGAADPAKDHRHDDRPRRHRLRTAARRIPDRPRPHRTAALRLPSLPGRARSAAAARSATSIAGAVADIFDALVATLSDTRLEPDLEDLLWSTVNLFHRATDRIERELDDNEQAQRKQPARTGRLRSPLGRTGAPHRRGHDADRAPQQPGILPRPGRRALRASTPARPGARASARWSTIAR